MSIAIGIGLVSQQIVQGEFGERDALVHGIEVVGVHGRDQLTDQMKSLGKRKGLALILEDFLGLVAKVVGFTAKGSNLV